MQNAAGRGASVEAGGRDDDYHSIVSHIAALIEQVQANLKLIESAIVSETSFGNHDIGANIVVLDDVTPGYLKAGAALKACDAGLGVALHFMLDSRTTPNASTSKHGTVAGHDCRHWSESRRRGVCRNRRR